MESCEGHGGVNSRVGEQSRPLLTFFFVLLFEFFEPTSCSFFCVFKIKGLPPASLSDAFGSYLVHQTATYPTPGKEPNAKCLASFKKSLNEPIRFLACKPRKSVTADGLPIGAGNGQTSSSVYYSNNPTVPLGDFTRQRLIGSDTSLRKCAEYALIVFNFFFFVLHPPGCYFATPLASPLNQCSCRPRETRLSVHVPDVIPGELRHRYGK